VKIVVIKLIKELIGVIEKIKAKRTKNIAIPTIKGIKRL